MKNANCDAIGSHANHSLLTKWIASVNTQKPAPATSVFIRDALEEHPWHALRRKTPNCTNSSNLSRQFLAEEFSSNPLRTRRSSTIFRYVWEERDTLNLGQINLGTTRASVSRLIKPCIHEPSCTQFKSLSAVFYTWRQTNRSQKKHPRMPKLLNPPSNPGSVRRRLFRWPASSQSASSTSILNWHKQCI